MTNTAKYRRKSFLFSFGFLIVRFGTTVAGGLFLLKEVRGQIVNYIDCQKSDLGRVLRHKLGLLVSYILFIVKSELVLSIKVQI